MVYKTGLVLMILLLAGDLFAGEGKLRIASEPSGAYVYVDGKKRAMTGDGFTSILVEEGDHSIKVVKAIDENFEYMQTKKVFVGEDTSTKLSFKLKRVMTAQGKVLQAQKNANKLALQARKDAMKLTRWKKSGDMVIDTKLRLMWQDDRAAKSVKKKWNLAKRYCKNLILGGYSDWRLPSDNELFSIVDYDRYDPAIMPSFENIASSDYWTNTEMVSFSKIAWGVNFKDGDTSCCSAETNKYYVRCVRYSQ